jgi:hypothetical protein
MLAPMDTAWFFLAQQSYADKETKLLVFVQLRAAAVCRSRFNLLKLDPGDGTFTAAQWLKCRTL